MLGMKTQPTKLELSSDVTVSMWLEMSKEIFAIFVGQEFYLLFLKKCSSTDIALFIEL